VRSRPRLPHVDPESDDDLPRPADLDNPEVRRLARAYATNVVLYGSATRVAPVDGDRGRDPDRHGRDGARTPVPAGAHREALEGVESVLAEYELTPGEAVHWPGWFQSTAADSTKRWLRADTGGLVEMEWGPYPLVYEGETICTITNHFKTEEHAIEAPSTG